MSKSLLYALTLIALCVLVLIFNRQRVEVNLVVDSIRAMGALVYLAFIAIGVVIGVLLK